MTTELAKTERLYFLDWLRILAFAALVVYHVGMYYVTWDFHVKSPFAGPGLEPWMKLTEPWRMSLLFMVSGAATALALRGRASGALARRRSAQLLLPLLCGVLLIVPPQAYFEVVQKFGHDGGYIAFLRLYFAGDSSFCAQGRCLVLPTWNHLWFLPYLWCYTVLLCGLVAWRPTLLRTASRAAEASLQGAVLMVLPVMAILAIRLALADRFPVTRALWDDGFSHALYLGMFAAGAVFAASRSMWDRLRALRWPALGMALVSWTVMVTAGASGAWLHAVVALFQWSALVAAFGFAKSLLNRDSPLRSRLTEAVFPVYLLHQTVIVVASQALLPLRWRPVVEGPLLVLLAFVISWIGYEVVRRARPLRPFFGLRSATPGRCRDADRGAIV